MKQTFLVILTVAVLWTFSGCGGKTSTESSFGKDASYALGMNVGTSMKTDGIYPDIKAFTQGMEAVLYDSTPRYTLEEAYRIFNQEFSALAERRNADNIQAEAEFLAENKEKPGIFVTDSGLQYEVLTEGDGPKPSPESVVQVHYQGSLTDGLVFDSSYESEPVQFPLAAVIPGWTEGLQLMNVGSKYRLFVPSNLGYGSQGAGTQIPPYATLVFEVELLDISQQNYQDY